MPIKVLMPALSPTMKEGTLTKWCKKEGDDIKSGEILAEIETDKATIEFEAVDEGKLAKILVPNGTTKVAVNSQIAIILEDGETEDDLKNFEVSTQKSELKENNETNINTPTQGKPAEAKKTEIATIQQRILATPLAKKIATQNEIDLIGVAGSGPHGRIIKDDVLKLTHKQEFAQITYDKKDEILEISGMRRVIAERLLSSKRNIPHFYLKSDCILDGLLNLREQINQKVEEKVTINDFIVKASALAMRKIPEIRVSWLGDKIIRYGGVDICVAVAIQNGLITPIIKDADAKSLSEISQDVKRLVKKAKDGSLLPTEFEGGCFTISNLGMYGIKEFYAIVNPPQSAILAVGAAEKRPVVIDDEVKIKTVMTITLSCDHRVIDGAICAQFLNKFKEYIENPVLMFV